MKFNKKWLAVLSVSALAFLGLGIGTTNFTTDTKTASAATIVDDTKRYVTAGQTTRDGEVVDTTTSYFRVSILGGGGTSGGTETIQPGTVLNLSTYNIVAERRYAWTDLSFRLYYNGRLVVDDAPATTSALTLYSGGLSNGSYEMVFGFTLTTSAYAGVYVYRYQFVVNDGVPTGVLQVDGQTVSSRSYTNKAVTYQVICDNFARLYYKRPGASAYSSTVSSQFTVSATESNEGVWSFYGVDANGVESARSYIYMDVTAPTGKLTKKDGTALGNGSYSEQPVSFTATDNASLLSLEYKAPNTTTWSTYTSGTLKSGTGWHTFRAVDRAGQYSEEYEVFYDNTAPTGRVVDANGKSIVNGGFTNAEYIQYTAGDSQSGIAACYVKKPNSDYYSAYTSGSQLTVEGTYTFYCKNRSGMESTAITVTLDKTKPVGTILADGVAIQNGEMTNAQEISFSVNDVNGVSAIYVKTPNGDGYVDYTQGTSFTEEGQYSFYAVDISQNTSEIYTATVDRSIPSAQLYVDEVAVGSGSYTNGGHIRFDCDETCYVKLPGADEFTPYIVGVEYYKPGKYVFYGETEAGTSSGEYSIVIDRTAKALTVSNVTDGKTDGDVVLDWTDGNPDEFAPVKKVTINGKEYTKGETIYTIDTAKYKVICEDAAGNTWETEFSSTKKNVFTQTLQKEYYEIHDANGEYFAFTSYENAFAFAVARENSFVKTAEWTSAAWDTGIAMDAKDSVNAKNGEYFIYKKEGDTSREVAYFTLERLNEVIAQYAKVGINDYYYWEKTPAPAGNGENLYSYSDNKTILASSVLIGENVACLLDGETFIGNIVEVEGDRILTVCDEWGNQCNYTLAVIRSVPDIEYAVGDGNKNTVTFDRTYYFKDEVRVSIADEYDEMAMFQVFDEDGNLLGDFNIEDSYLLTESGKYEVVAVNHYGKSEVFTFIISRESPKVELTENGEEKRLQILITESVDDESHLQTLEIYKSVDGDEWVLLEKDDYGRQINLDTLEYYFRTTGLYKVVITDEFRTGIDAVSGQIDYTQPIPNGILTGVENGGYTNGKVKFEWTDEAIVTLTKNGEGILYGSGDELTEDGEYVLTFANFDGYTATYAFVIDTVAPEATLNGATDGQTVAKDVSASFVSDGVTAKLYKDSELVGDYLPDTVITESGAYRIVATDLALNSTEVSFTIDKLVNYDINIYDKGLANSVTLTATEALTVVLTKDGEVVEYTLGDVIDKAGNYALTLTDELGNTVEMSFVIVNPLVKEFSYNFDEVKGFEKVLEGEEERRLNYGTLELKAGGVYELNVLVDGKLYPFTVTVDDTAPTLTMTGVENGGTTTANVVLSAPSEKATVKVYLNDSEVSYTPGGKLTGVGKYRVVLTDEVGRTTEYAFEILAIKKSNTGKTIGIVAGIVGGLAVVGGVALWLIKRRKGE